MRHNETNSLWVLIFKKTFLKKQKQEVSQDPQDFTQLKCTGSQKVYNKLLATSRKQEKLLIHKQKTKSKLPKALKSTETSTKPKERHNLIPLMKDSQGMLHSMTSTIRQFKDYYTNLYKSKKTRISLIAEFMNHHPMPKHSEDQRALLEQLFTTKEMKETIKKLKGKNTQGQMASYINKFYQKYMTLLIQPLAPTSNHIMKTGQLPPIWTQAMASHPESMHIMTIL